MWWVSNRAPRLISAFPECDCRRLFRRTVKVLKIPEIPFSYSDGLLLFTLFVFIQEHFPEGIIASYCMCLNYLHGTVYTFKEGKYFLTSQKCCDVNKHNIYSVMHISKQKTAWSNSAWVVSMVFSLHHFLPPPPPLNMGIPVKAGNDLGYK